MKIEKYWKMHTKFINTKLFNDKSYFDYINEVNDLVSFKNLLLKLKKDYINKKRKKLNFD